MKTLVFATLGALALTGAANAHDYSGDLACSVTDANGRTTGWTFANNTDNADGSVGGTMVETAVLKANGQTIASQPGTRPVWIIFANQQRGLTLRWRQDPSWIIGMDAISLRGNWYSAPAHLYHYNTEVARGSCVRVSNGQGRTANNVGDESRD